MEPPPTVRNSLRAARTARGWTQRELAARAGISRASIGAIETGRLVPSTAAALALAAALACRVEDLFHLGDAPAAPRWAWDAADDARYWVARVDDQPWRYPVEPTLAGMLPHDGRGATTITSLDDALDRTLVLAGCDPAVGVLVAELAREEGVRVLPLTRGSGAALDLLRRGLVHAAGTHLSDPRGGDGADVVRARLGAGHTVLTVATWENGVAVAEPGRVRTARGFAAKRARWIGREAGSGARQCLDELIGTRAATRTVARDHVGVASAIRAGCADAGICPRLVCADHNLAFLPYRRESYDLCVPTVRQRDPRVAALIRVVRSARFRSLIAELPGYDATTTGQLRTV